MFYITIYNHTGSLVSVSSDAEGPVFTVTPGAWTSIPLTHQEVISVSDEMDALAQKRQSNGDLAYTVVYAFDAAYEGAFDTLSATEPIMAYSGSGLQVADSAVVAMSSAIRPEEVVVPSVGADEVGVVNSTTGGLTKYATIVAALAAIVDADAERISIGAGLWTETLVVPDGVFMYGAGNGEVIVSASTDDATLTLGDGARIAGITVRNTYATQSNIVFTGSTTASVATIEDCNLDSTSAANGILCTQGTLNVRDVLIVEGTFTCGIRAQGGTVNVNGFSAITGTYTSFICVDGTGSLLCQNVVFDALTAALNITNGIEVGTGGELYAVSPILRGCDNCLYISGESVDVTMVSARLEATASPVVVEPGLTGVGSAYSNSFPTVKGATVAVAHNAWLIEVVPFAIISRDSGPDREFNLVSCELNVGSVTGPAESNFGEGDSYFRGMLVYTQASGGAFTNVTTDAVAGTPVTLEGTGADNAIYFGSAATDKQGVPHRFHGLKVALSTALDTGSGGVLLELWDGTSWVDTAHLSVRDEQPIPYGDALLERASVEQVYFDYNVVEDSWAVSDPMSLGLDLFWARIRVDATVDVLPVFTQVKLHANRFSITEDGFVQHFGRSRPAMTFPFDIGLLEPGAASPANADMFLSTKIQVGRKENAFVDGVTDRQGTVFAMPAGIDTSSGLKFRIYYTVTTALMGDIEFKVYWATSDVGAAIATTSGTAAATAVGQRDVTTLIPVAAMSNGVQRVQELTLDIRDMRAVGADGTPTLLWISFERPGASVDDTYAGNMHLLQIVPGYRAWAPGAYLL